jgi:hypothetical protein
MPIAHFPTRAGFLQAGLNISGFILFGYRINDLPATLKDPGQAAQSFG